MEFLLNNLAEEEIQRDVSVPNAGGKGLMLFSLTGFIYKPSKNEQFHLESYYFLKTEFKEII